MSPHFFHDYRDMIRQEPYLSQLGRVLYYKCHAQDMEGDAILGCKGTTPADAYWGLCDFIDGELERRKTNLP